MDNSVFNDDLYKLTIHESEILKGIAIISVLVNHFINSNVDKTITKLYLSGYANGFIIIFFILSGYGIYYSLSRYNGRGKWKYFYLKRFLRIYPLFIVALLLYSLVTGTWPTIQSFFFIKSPYWFIDAIVFCYLLTPIFIFIIDKLTFNRFIQFFVLTTIAFAVITYLTKGYSLPLPFIRYRYIVFSFFLIYIGGMALIKYKHEISKCLFLDYTKIYLITFFIFIFLTRTRLGWFHQVINGSIFIFISLLLIGSVIKTRCLKNKKLKIIAFFGTYSYSIYLFQAIYYRLIFKFSNHEFFSSLLFTIIFLPLFLAFCYFIENYWNKYTNYLLNKIIGGQWSD